MRPIGKRLPRNSEAFYKRIYSEELIRKYIEKYPGRADHGFWYDISRYQTLSEDFIREFQDRVDWHWIPFGQTLSEEFIREFQDKLNWFVTSMCQNLSEEFMIEFIEKIVIDNEYKCDIRYNFKIPEEVKERIINLKKVIDQ